MKRYVFSAVCGLSLLFASIMLSAQEPNVIFKSTVSTSSQEAIPNIYVKIYSPGSEQAVDSLFSDDKGKINYLTPFYYAPGTGVKTPSLGKQIILHKISPNIITQPHQYYELKYVHPSDAQLTFVNAEGKTFSNHSELSSGIYFYYLSFEDGSKSEFNKLMVTNNQRVNVKLTNLYGSALNHNSLVKNSVEDAGKFYVEFIKDGFITKTDTLEITSTLIEKDYNLAGAPAPTAEFSVSGDLIAGEVLLFDASFSTGGNGEEITYAWDFGDDKKGQSAGIPHVYNLPGDFDVTLTVMGRFGAKHSITKTITIAAGLTATEFDGIIAGNIKSESLLGIPGVKISIVENTATGLSDDSGEVYLSGLPVDIPLHLCLTKPGYVNQVIEVLIPSDTKEALFYTTMKTRTTVITMQNAEFGGKVEGVEGTKVELPVDALLTDEGIRVSGNIDISITPVDVAFETESFPGTFNAYREDGEDGVLLSYGVSEFHFTQGNEELELAPGKVATIIVPIYTSGAVVGDEIALWSVNESNGTWIQEGTGTVIESEDSPTGLALMAEIGHFSWWNCDDFEDERNRGGLCWRWECSSAICVKVKVGCWMSGAQRGSSSGSIRPSAHASVHKRADRDTIPPVFEVRAFVPTSGSQLRFPSTRDVYIEARAVSSAGEFLVGSHTVEASDMTDTFSIELAVAVPSDTVHLELNTILEDYLEKKEHITVEIEVPADNHLIVFVQYGELPHLNGVYTIKNNNNVISSGIINAPPANFYAEKGHVYISIAGQNETEEGNYIIAVYEDDYALEGDTIPISLNVPHEDSVNMGVCKHFSVNIAETRMHRVNVRFTQPPYLFGHYTVKQGIDTLTTGTINEGEKYIEPIPGELIISVYGDNPLTVGNFSVELYDVRSTPIAINDSIYDSLTIGNNHRCVYSLETDRNTVLNARVYKAESAGGSGQAKFFWPNSVLYENLTFYETHQYINSPIGKNSEYLFEITGGSEFDFIIVTEEDEQYDINYGDTVNSALEYRKDIDMYHFDGVEGEYISIKCGLPSYGLNGGMLQFYNHEGLLIGERNIDSYGSTDDEIVYRLPVDGTYSIAVSSTRNDEGEYQIILNKIHPTLIDYNSLSTLSLSPESESYYTVLIPENVNTSLTIYCNASSGNWDMWSNTGDKINDYQNRFFMDYNIYPFVGKFPGGIYFLKLTNKAATEAYVNLWEPTQITFGPKGFVSLNDAFEEEHRTKSYQFTGRSGDGIHAIINRRGKLGIPGEIEMALLPLSGKGDQVYPEKKKIGWWQYSTSDTTILAEMGEKLSPDYTDTTWVLFLMPESAGQFEFTMHSLNQSLNIVVDDDFAQNPDAHTSSPVVAGYALAEGGELLISNGEYRSYLPVRIEAENIEIRGQEKDKVFLINSYNQHSHPALYLYGSVGKVHNISASTGENCYPTLQLYGNNLLINDIEIKPFGTHPYTQGQVKVNGNDVQIRNVTHSNAVEGINFGGNTGLVENCTTNTKRSAIVCSGDEITVKHNVVTVSEYMRAIRVSSGSGQGNHVVDSNHVTMTNITSTSDNGIIYVQENGRASDNNTTYLRNNTILSAGDNVAFMLVIGNPPSQMIAENNTFKSTYTTGSKAVYLQGGRSDGAGSIIVRNNTFDGLCGRNSIYLYYFDVMGEGHQFGLYNNSFRMATGATPNIGHSMINTYPMYTTFTDTAEVYLVNNIFEGNGVSYFINCYNNFKLYSDYNVVYDFSKYIGDLGTLIGTANDQTEDPIFLDDDLHISTGSSAINNGASPTLYPLIPTVDKDGTTRPLGGNYDIGAYERE